MGMFLEFKKKSGKRDSDPRPQHQYIIEPVHGKPREPSIRDVLTRTIRLWRLKSVRIISEPSGTSICAHPCSSVRPRRLCVLLVQMVTSLKGRFQKSMTWTSTFRASAHQNDVTESSIARYVFFMI